MLQSKKVITCLFSFVLSLFTLSVFAQNNSDLQKQRLEVIKRYVKLMNQGKYKIIPQLFTKNATAISSSGAVDNPVHFYTTLFTKTLSNPHASLINIFVGQINTDMMAGYFNFSWKNTHGKNVSAKFLDLFVFQNNTTKIKNIFIFSNTFQQDIMKQLE